MNIFLLPEGEQWFWSLRHGDHEFARSLLFEKFIFAKRDAEEFRMSSCMATELDDPLTINPPLLDYEIRFCVMKHGRMYQLEIIYPPGPTLFGSHSSHKEAVDFMLCLVNDIFEMADIVDSNGNTFHPLSYSRRYREMFDINDDHPSSL
ncbi:hypothetical protein M0854_002831 [Salmonella enterica]|nr:hypothetical protein [Salmonella enterica]